MIKIKKSLMIVFCVIGCLGFTGCLKTRGQLRDDAEDRGSFKPVPVQPAQEVEPKGQYAIDEIKSEFTRLEGRMEDLERSHKSQMSKSNSADDLKKLEARVTHLEQAHSGFLETIEKLQESLALADPNELYQKAKAQFAEHDYEEAAETLGLYLKSSKVKHPEDGIFLRGECFYKLKQYKKAIVEFSKFPEKYPHSSRNPEALYKIALSFDALGMKEDAKGFYQELVEKYPKSPDAKKARKKAK